MARTSASDGRESTPRYAWQLRLDNGVHLMLGRDLEAALARLERFVAVVDGSQGRMTTRFEYVDLRYPNGFALRVGSRG